MRDWREIIDKLLEIIDKYEEAMTDEDLEELSKLRNEYFIQYNITTEIIPQFN